MSQVFNQQTLLTLRLDSKDDLSTASSAKILFQRPDGSKGEWDGNIEGMEIVYNILADDITPGRWSFQVKYTVSGKIAYGDIVQINFAKNLEP